VTPRTETPADGDSRADLRPLLDEELTRLPAKYRAPLVLCDLEGRTRKEAAQQLGLAEGTVASRQARARVMLAKRLTRHGVALSGGGPGAGHGSIGGVRTGAAVAGSRNRTGCHGVCDRFNGGCGGRIGSRRRINGRSDKSLVTEQTEDHCVGGRGHWPCR